jgi:hypothetical protein
MMMRFALLLLVGALPLTAQQARVLTADDSLAIMWRAACGPGRPLSSDSALVFGAVRDAATGKPVAGALVEIIWSELLPDGDKKIKQRNYRLEAVADQNGNYGACGVPTESVVHFHGVAGSRSTGVIDLTLGERRLFKFDLAVGQGSTAATFGTVTGIVLGSDDRPLANARVTIGEKSEVRTGADGRFVARQVPIGTQQVEAAVIGMEPVTQVAEVKPNETVDLRFTARRVAALDTIKVRGLTRQQLLPREINERRRLGVGHFVDSARLEKTGMSLRAAFSDVPSTYVRILNPQSAIPRWIVTLPTGMGRCTANVLVDRVAIPPESIDMYRPGDIAMIEVYARPLDVPLDLVARDRECGVVAIWTKNALR